MDTLGLLGPSVHFTWCIWHRTKEKKLYCHKTPAVAITVDSFSKERTICPSHSLSFLATPGRRWIISDLSFVWSHSYHHKPWLNICLDSHCLLEGKFPEPKLTQSILLNTSNTEQDKEIELTLLYSSCLIVPQIEFFFCFRDCGYGR